MRYRQKQQLQFFHTLKNYSKQQKQSALFSSLTTDSFYYQYANQKDVEIGKESVYGYDIQVDSEYMITIKEKSVAIGEDLWSKNTEVRKIKIQ